MTVPPPYESWEPAEPMGPKDLPPGFYFPPESEPSARDKAGSGGVWLLVAIVAVVLIAIAFGAILLF